MSYTLSTKQPLEYDFIFKNFFIKNTFEHDLVYISEEALLIIEGFVYDLNTHKNLNAEEIITILKKCRELKSVLPDHITGQYNLIYISDDKIDLINDFVGMKPLYYHFGSEIIISNSIYVFSEFNFKKDSVALFQSMIGNLYIPLNCRTYFDDVKLLRNGEYIRYDITKIKQEVVIDSIDMINIKITNKEVNSFVALLQTNAAIYLQNFKKITLPISGGVDSRVTLSSFKELNKDFNLISYGEADYIDNKIAKNIAEYIGLSHENVSFINSLFPTNAQFDALIKNGGDYFLSCWFSVLGKMNTNQKYNDSVVLLGDVLDTLRAKNVKFLRSRADRVKYQLKSFLGIELKLEPLNIKKYADNQKKVYTNRIKQLYVANPTLLSTLEFDEDQFIKQTELDIDLFINYLVKKFNPKNQANLEEAFYLCTWGARTMGKQANVFKGTFQNYVLMATRHVVKHNLKYAPLDRFEDKLTHKMLRVTAFNKYSKFPTSQIPFISYDKNIYIKYALWAFRSKVDQIRIKSGKGRLVKHIEWIKYYKSTNNKILLEDLLKDVDEDLKKLPLEIFDKRADGTLWPLSEVDINMYTYLLKLNNLN